MAKYPFFSIFSHFLSLAEIFSKTSSAMSLKLSGYLNDVFFQGMTHGFEVTTFLSLWRHL